MAEKTCNNCNGNQKMPESVPYIVHEGAMARSERTIKRLIAAMLLSVILLFVTNVVWLCSWTSYDYYTEQVTIDGQDGGTANYIGQDGNIYNGEDSSSAQGKN